MLTENEFYEHIGRQVKLFRLQTGLKQGELANKVGLTRTSITNIESGLQQAPTYTLYKIAVATGCALGDLFADGQESPISDAALDLLERMQRLSLNSRERVILLAQLTDGVR